MEKPKNLEKDYKIVKGKCKDCCFQQECDYTNYWCKCERFEMYQKITKQNSVKPIDKLINKPIEKPIDKVTTQALCSALLVCNIKMDAIVADKIIEVIKLLEEKGDEVTITEINELISEWKR
jgi:hypothetical protein